MIDAAAELVAELARRGHEPLLKKTSGTVRFDVLDGGRTHRWRVTVDKGDLAVSRGNVSADCVVRTEKAVLEAMLRGEMNAMAALLRGAVTVEGDPELLVHFQRLLPGPKR